MGAERSGDSWKFKSLHRPHVQPGSTGGAAIRLSVPEFDWEIRGFSVNEGPSVLIRNGRMFISYSASATDENYAMGLLYARDDADLLDPRSWSKSPQPVFKTCYEHGVYGPGHNSFTVAEDGKTDMLVYHARTYAKIEGDPVVGSKPAYLRQALEMGRPRLAGVWPPIRGRMMIGWSAFCALPIALQICRVLFTEY